MERQYRLLIVDDEDAILKPYQEFFQDYGFYVDTAHNGQEGLEKLRTGEFDVAIVDILMPVMDGMAMIRKANEEGVDPDFILLTGHGGEKEAVEAVNIGVSAWFYKHEIEMSKLKAKVEDLAQVIPADLMRKVMSEVPEKEWTE